LKTNHLFRVLCLSLTLGLAAGCSNSSASGSALPPASPEMTKQATHAMSSVQKLFELKQTGSRNKGSRPLPRHLLMNALTPSLPPESGTPNMPGVPTEPSLPNDSSTSKPAAPMDADFSARKLERELSSNDCVFDIPIDQDPNAGQNPPANGSPSMDIDIKEIRASISGPNCPLEAVIELTGGLVNNQINAKVNMRFVAKTAEMQQELRAKSMSLAGTISGTIVQGANNSVSTDTTAQMTGAGVLMDDQAFSTTMNLALKMDITPPDANAPPPKDVNDVFGMDFFTMQISQSQRYDFGATATSLGMSALMKGFTEAKESYTINGRAATREEYNAYASQISIPGFETPGQPGEDRGSTPGPGTAPGGDRPALCSLQVFDVKEVSLIDLKDAIRRNSSPRGFPLQTLQSCQDNVKTDFKTPAAQVQMSIQHSFDFIVAEVAVNGRPQSLYIQREDNTRLADQNDEISFIFQCQPVAQCR
jgi:hypothetical protein